MFKKKQEGKGYTKKRMNELFGTINPPKIEDNCKLRGLGNCIQFSFCFS